MSPRAVTLGVVACVIAAAAHDLPPTALGVTVGGSATGTVFDTAVTLDFWPAGKDKWGTAGALTLDVANADLRTLANGLSGAVLRLGGSPADTLLYDVVPGACSAENLNRTQQKVGDYYCPVRVAR